MRPIASRQLAPAAPVHRDPRDARDAGAAIAQEVSVRRAADGGQIVVRRVLSAEDGDRGRTLHIDAVVR